MRDTNATMGISSVFDMFLHLIFCLIVRVAIWHHLCATVGRSNCSFPAKKPAFYGEDGMEMSNWSQRIRYLSTSLNELIEGSQVDLI